MFVEETQNATISFQVVQETLNVLTRKLPTPMTAEGAKHFLEWVLAPLWRVSPSSALYHHALDIQDRYRYGFYDSLIVAAALDAGCTRLTIENPFRD